MPLSILIQNGIENKHSRWNFRWGARLLRPPSESATAICFSFVLFQKLTPVEYLPPSLIALSSTDHLKSGFGFPAILQVKMRICPSSDWSRAGFWTKVGAASFPIAATQAVNDENKRIILYWLNDHETYNNKNKLIIVIRRWRWESARHPTGPERASERR